MAAGGIAVANPEPLRAFIDLFAFGDGEAIFPDLVDVLKKARREKTDRAGVLEEFDRVDGVYVPGLYPLKKKGAFLVPDLGGKRIRKRVCPDLDRVRAEPAEIVPICDVVFNRLNVEIARGCPQNCRFCQAKSYYAPFRCRAPPAHARFHQRRPGRHRLRNIFPGIAELGRLPATCRNCCAASRPPSSPTYPSPSRRCAPRP